MLTDEIGILLRCLTKNRQIEIDVEKSKSFEVVAQCAAELYETQVDRLNFYMSTEEGLRKFKIQKDDGSYYSTGQVYCHGIGVAWKMGCEAEILVIPTKKAIMEDQFPPKWLKTDLPYKSLTFLLGLPNQTIRFDIEASAPVYEIMELAVEVVGVRKDKLEFYIDNTKLRLQKSDGSYLLAIEVYLEGMGLAWRADEPALIIVRSCIDCY